METQIVEKDGFTVMGVQSRSPYENDDFGTIWKEFMTHHDAVQAHSTDGAHYGLNFPTDDGDAVVYLAGMAVEGVEDAPEGLVVREVPGGRYAVFECTVETIHDTYEHIFHEWLPVSEHRQDLSRPCFELYPPGTTTGSAPVLIHVPITLQQDAGGCVAPGCEGAHMLEGLVWKQRFVAHLGCMKGCLEFFGSDVSFPWLYGGTGHAFALNIAEGLDPSGPTAWHWEMIHTLGPNLGFRVKAVSSPEGDAADVRAARQREAWDLVRDAVNRGLPCYGWGLNLWIPDYYVITGYDEVGYYWSGWGESKDPLPWQKLGTGDVPVLQVFRLEPCRPASDAAAVKAALADVLAHVEDPGGWTIAPAYRSGVAAYDAWAQALEAGTAERDGNAYNAATWHECREMAVEFLKEAKGRLPSRCDPAFDEAIAHYTAVRDRLKALSDRCPMPKEGWDTQTRIKSAKAAALVREAGAAERKGVQTLRKIAAALAAEGGQAPAEGRQGGT